MRHNSELFVSEKHSTHSLRSTSAPPYSVVVANQTAGTMLNLERAKRTALAARRDFGNCATVSGAQARFAPVHTEYSVRPVNKELTD